MLVALTLSFAAAGVAGTASGAPGAASAEGPAPLAEFVRSGQRAACVGLRNQITSSTVTSLAAGWLVAHEDSGARYSLRPETWPARVRSMGAAARRDERRLDRYGALFLQTYGPKALGGCLGQERHAPAAAKHFAWYACKGESKGVPGIVATLVGDAARTNDLFGPRNWLGPCMRHRAGSTRLTQLAQAQVEAAMRCQAQLAAGASAVGGRPAAFGSCVLKHLHD